MPDGNDIVARLRDHAYRCELDIEDAANEIENLRREIDELIQERDEARRNLCLSEAADLSFGENGVPYHPSVAHKIAADYGWNCFPCFNKENTND